MTLLLSGHEVRTAGENESERTAPTADAGARPLTAAEERAVGRRMAFFYAQRHAPVKDKQTSAVLARVAARLENEAGVPPLEIGIVRGTRAEAISFPGGHVFVTTALLKEARDEDELAAALAHEAAHSAARHSARLISAALRLPAEERPGFPTRAEIVTGRAFNFYLPRALDAARHDCEAEADRIAVRWLERAGYRAAALGELLTRLASTLPRESRDTRAALHERATTLAAPPPDHAGK
ncbi:MAG: M48 family metalloprotease [Pyrinomonadaceae bacterium]